MDSLSPGNGTLQEIVNLGVSYDPLEFLGFVRLGYQLLKVQIAV